MKQFRSLLLYIAVLSGICACDDLTDQEILPGAGSVPEEGTAEIYILSEGLFNQNNSSLARHTFTNNRTVGNYFSTLNHRGLGDTANDMKLYGNKIYIVVNVSSQIEVIDRTTGLSLKQIPMLSENGSSRQPRNIAFEGDKAYVCSFDGTVARIDTASLSIDGWTTAGRNPDNLCAQNGKLYVSNSGGLDSETIGVDRTVSVIDLTTFHKVKDIIVGSNPGKITVGPNENIFVAIRGEKIESGDYKLVEIDTRTDEIHRTFNEKVLNFAVNDDLAYLYNYNYSTQKASFKVFNLRTGETVRENFITDGTNIQTPYGIYINPYNGNIYITDAYTYNVKGDVLCFNPQGQLQFRLNNVGINPNAIVFSDRLSQSNIDDTPQDPDAPSAFANRVLAYRPAPGQFMNTLTTGYKEGFTANDVLKQANESIRKQYLLSLGGFGGYIVLGFHEPIRNIPGEYDFKVHSNASYNMYGTATGALGGSAEPGIVLVAKDENKNGLPDDTWYELAGSEYGKDTETRGYAITYYRPSSAKESVRWTDNQGEEGYVHLNSFHSQSYYPLWVSDETMTFSGTRLKDNAVNEKGTWVGYCYPWGYADNHPNNTEMSKFKLDWAVNEKGEKVSLDQVDFVKICSAINQSAGQMGEVSTEVMTVENLHFNQ